MVRRRSRFKPRAKPVSFLMLHRRFLLPSPFRSSCCIGFSFRAVVFSCTSTVVLQAFAKQHGSYEAISGGHVCEAFEALTGAPTETVMLGKASFRPPV